MKTFKEWHDQFDHNLYAFESEDMEAAWNAGRDAGIDWQEYTAGSYPPESGWYLRWNENLCDVETLFYVEGKGDDKWWENDEGSLITGTTHWAELPAGPK